MFMKTPPEVLGAGMADIKPLPRLAIGLIVLALLAPFALYLSTVRSIVGIWNSSETFAHGYVIVPISLWLVWRRRENFAAFPPTPYWPALLLLAAAGAAWLTARVGEVQVVQQYAFASMIPIIALALLGRRLASSLAFPLLFVLFAVPFGEIFVAPLINFTADFTVAAIRLTGIPVLRSGTRFELPSGTWSVVEACSGVRYLISSITLGCLYAYLTFRTTSKRLMFIGVSVIVPVIANGLRAYMIVMIGHLSGMKLAVGVDHLIYGWLFFGLVMFIMFWIGSFWREDEAPPAAERSAVAHAAPRVQSGPIAAMTAAVLLVCALWPVFARYNDKTNFNAHPVHLGALAIGWPRAADESFWSPHYLEPDARVDNAFQRAGLPPVDLHLLYYRNQDGAKALISSVNRLAGYKDAWHEIDATTRVQNMGGRQLAIRESVLASARGKLLVWHWMWIDGRYTDSNVIGKLWQARARLLRHGDDGAALMVASPFTDKPDQARAALRAFMADNFTAIDAALAAARER
jgi:exosortase A